MVARLKKNVEPEDKAFLEAVVALLKKLKPLMKMLLLPRKISPLEMAWKL